MAEPVGEFNLKNTGNSFNRTSDGQLEQASDFEGEATGFGAVFGTLVITQPLAEASRTKSACAWIGKALLGDNSILGGIGDGTVEQVGKDAKWQVSLVIQISDGSKLRSEGVVDHGARTYTGKLYEA